MKCLAKKSVLSGAIDVIAVRDKEGNIKCTPFHVRFGANKVVAAKKEKVDVFINGKEISNLNCRLSSSGDVYFRVTE